MTRTAYTVTLTAQDGTPLATATAYALNSAARASERLMREHARQVGQAYTGDRPERTGPTYRRTWHGDRTGDQVLATVTPETPAAAS
jgi:hypothetical protein